MHITTAPDIDVVAIHLTPPVHVDDQQPQLKQNQPQLNSGIQCKCLSQLSVNQYLLPLRSLHFHQLCLLFTLTDAIPLPTKPLISWLRPDQA
jgi:hypothetical protein